MTERTEQLRDRLLAIWQTGIALAALPPDADDQQARMEFSGAVAALHDEHVTADDEYALAKVLGPFCNVQLYKRTAEHIFDLIRAAYAAAPWHPSLDDYEWSLYHGVVGNLLRGDYTSAAGTAAFLASRLGPAYIDRARGQEVTWTERGLWLVCRWGVPHGVHL